MAEIAVKAALLLLETVSPYFNKLNSPKNVDIKSMQSWLSSMNAFMVDNYGREGSKLLDDQMHKIRDIAYDIQDVIEEFVLHSPPYTFHNHKFTRNMHNFAHQLHHGFPLHGLSDKIASINRRIEDMKEQTAALSVRSSGSPLYMSSCTLRIGRQLGSTSLLLDDEMVGYKKPRKEFTRQLIEGEMRLLTLAVDGASGSGKTTFVKNVFLEKGIQEKFDCYAWIRVSRHFDVEELLISVLKQVCGSMKEPYPGEQDGSTTSAKLRRYLSGKRYMVVLDDVWRRGDGNSIKNEFPDSNCGSRIIITTRSSKLASSCASSTQNVHTLKHLEWGEGWNLFCRKVFPDSNGECPDDLREASVKIVKRCEGLPLAIVAVGGALASKPRRPNDWKRFNDNLGDGMGDDSNLCVIINGLLLSYMDLSTNLKCCFLYFSIFPEDYSVNRGRLVRLWVAERFAMETDFKTAEEVAEEYLNELIQRNLLHVSDWDFDGRPGSCRVLNLIHEFIIQKCKEENFASIFPRENAGLSQKIRRLSVHGDCSNLPRNSELFGVRSMFLSRLINKPDHDFERHLSRLVLLRVLDFEGAHLTEFPKDVTRLTLLKYLSLRKNEIKIIPSSIKCLSYLETLDLKQTEITELPQEISFLHSLCHLFVYKTEGDEVDSVQGVKLHEGIDNLTNLQDLSLVKVGKEGGILKDIRKLTRLRKLGLTGLKSEHGQDLCAAVESMENLTTLDLCAATKEEFLEVGEMSNPPQTLQRLYLKGRLREFPSWISSLDNLLRIGLKWSKMEDSPLSALQHLPNLMELQLVDCCIGEELLFEAWCFKKLKILLIEDLAKLETIVVRQGAMPQLRKISIGKCPQLKTFPVGLSLINIEELSLYDMAEEFVGRLRMHGEDREWVKHIPLIHSTWTLEDFSVCL
ncbi:hypothetical protein ACS0TY_032444 [Phlomoides rotata]